MWCANENNMTNINYAQVLSKHKWASIMGSHKYKCASPFIIDHWFLFPNIIIYAHSCSRCFFDLLVIPLSYNFGGHFRSIYPFINLEYRPLEVMRPSEPSSTYTLIGPWCKSMLKMLLITFFKLLFLESCVMLKSFWQALSHYQVILWCSFFFLLPAWAACGGGHHYWTIFRHEVGWPPKKSFIYFSSLSNFLKDDFVGPQLCLSIPNGQYPHCGAYD